METTVRQNQAPVAPHRVTVLLIDDQAMVGEAVRRMVAGEEDIVFHYCQDPTAALQTAAEIKPTVILQDLVMPEVDGLTLVKYFRANDKTRDIPLIVLSTKEEPAVKAEAFALGANDYLVKLPDRIELLARIRHHSQGYINLLERNEAMKRLVDELHEAAAYVTSLLPAPMKTGSPRTDWRFIPSTSLGGDTFGYHWLDEDHFALYLLDVCGHGVGAALLSVSVMNVLLSQSLPKTDFREPDQVLTGLNNSFQMDTHNMYFTMWYGVYNRRTRKLAFSSGGHPPALLFSGPSSAATQLQTKNLVVGGMPGIQYTQDSVEIKPASRLFLYSDGVYEITKPDGTLWQLNEFVVFMGSPPNPGESVMDRLLKHDRELGGTEILDDDFSIVEFVFD